MSSVVVSRRSIHLTRREPRGLRLGEDLKGLVDLGQKVFVAHQQRARVVAHRRAHQVVDRADLQPDVAQVGEVAAVEQRDGHGRAVHAAGAGAADDVDPGRAARHIQQLRIDRVLLRDEPEDLVAHPAHPHGEAHAPIHHQRKPQFFALLDGHGSPPWVGLLVDVSAPDRMSIR